MAYDNTNSGLLRKNQRKEKDTHPDYQGTINVAGVDYWLSGWLKTGREGSKMAGERYFSLSVKPKDTPTRSEPTTQAAPAPAPKADVLDEDVPF